jgi:hypothetical protein
MKEQKVWLDPVIIMLQAIQAVLNHTWHPTLNAIFEKTIYDIKTDNGLFGGYLLCSPHHTAAR